MNGLRLLPTSNPFNDVLPSLVDYFTAAMQVYSVYIIAHKSEKSFMMKIAAADKRSLSEVCLVGFLRYICMLNRCWANKCPIFSDVSELCSNVDV